MIGGGMSSIYMMHAASRCSPHCAEVLDAMRMHWWERGILYALVAVVIVMTGFVVRFVSKEWRHEDWEMRSAGLLVIFACFVALSGPLGAAVWMP